VELSLLTGDHQPTVQLNLQLIIVDVELIHRIADWLPNLNLEASISRTNNTYTVIVSRALPFTQEANVHGRARNNFFWARYLSRPNVSLLLLLGRPY
jgi:hypothetical protein